ncbi:MAG: winged helix-turn-helix transcriptional regulator [Rhodospirillaceae bacterium]|nr:winged helix-turn-helix transcriptional regulator [Rhodospirillaceae bacterium]MBT5514798.1 winged helix-turn-helix transcriptional regulator [Rhodospirillaceae bacterium]MBT6086329.1 winged helix-turn-helix transcriptional regulator [Rhodospirillaceae bacterium]MBT6610097.1 winged helix-turn-helix transcriptional regulator [Rhodospirillaceae bacterium]MBT7509093.1 winged helix-turn-helix transcriptional regulator [Rhodospirillaceae bacterium]
MAGTVSQTLVVLERKKLIVKKSDPKDRRNVQLELTPAGRLLLDDDPIMAVRNNATALGETNEVALLAGLKRLLHVTLEERGGRAFGVCHSCKYFLQAAEGGAIHRCALLDAPLSDEDSEQICVENVFG